MRAIRVTLGLVGCVPAAGGVVCANWLIPEDIMAPRVVRFNFTMSF